MSSSRHKFHKTYGRCGCKWSKTRVLWFRLIFKKMVEIYITFCPKCVCCELFHLMWPDKSSPLYRTRKQATELQTNLGASADWYIHVSQAYRTAFPNFFHTLQKVSGHAKMCALCIEKKKKAPSRRGNQTTYKCKQCDLPLCRVGCILEYHKQRNVEVQN